MNAVPLPPFPERHAADALPAAPCLVAMLDAVDYPMILLDRDCVLHANRMALEALRGKGLLRIEAGRLGACVPTEQRLMIEAIDAAQRRGMRRLIVLSGSGAPLHLALLPIGEATDGASAVLMILARPGLCPDLTVGFFARRHGLTPAETNVLDLLCRGLRVGQIAMQLGVKMATVRTQVSAIRTKTGAASIGDMLHQISLLPPMVCRPALVPA